MAAPSRSSPNLTAEAVVAAAAAVLERDGHGGLTMRAVAAELGVPAPALYWYFKDKQALELALYDHLLADLRFEPRGADWREDLRGMAQGLRAHLVSRRDIGKLPPPGFFFAPNAIGLMEMALGVLLDAGFPPRDAYYVLITAVDYVSTWARGEAELHLRPVERPGLDEAAKRSLIDGAYPNFARVAQAFLQPGGVDEQFAFGLDALIAGFERLIPATGRG